MFRFRLGSIPVEVHPSHLLVAAVFAMWMTGPVSLPVIVLWMFLISFSILFHELGHAFVSRRYGYRPSIQLAWLGGNTQPHAPAPIPWLKDVLLTVAGPAFGLLLGFASYFAQTHVPSGTSAHRVLRGLAFINISWSLLNLLPVLPLDGGRVMSAVLRRLFRNKGMFSAWLVSAVLAAVLAVVSYRIQQLYVALLFGMFAFQAIQVVSAMWRASREVIPPQLEQAQEAFGRQDYPQARSLVAPLLDAQVSPGVRARVHHLLGWIALKEGEGREALDHFAQVGGAALVEKEALAAAFSLLGDDVRALPLWELAFRERPTPNVRHEWVGTLLRLGREPDAARIPEADLTAGWRCAERVYFLRGAFAQAASAGVRAFERAPSASLAYDIACAHARAHQPTQALEWLQRAAQQGFKDASYAERDPDLATLHGQREFEAWTRSLQESAAN